MESCSICIVKWGKKNQNINIIYSIPFEYKWNRLYNMYVHIMYIIYMFTYGSLCILIYALTLYDRCPRSYQWLLSGYWTKRGKCERDIFTLCLSLPFGFILRNLIFVKFKSIFTFKNQCSYITENLKSGKKIFFKVQFFDLGKKHF